MMKRTIPVILILCVILSACGSGRKTTDTPINKTDVQATEAVATPAPTPEPTPAPTPSPTPEPTPTPDPYSYDDLLASVYGYTNNRSEDSMYNIELACSKLDGLKIMPGETFSFNDAVGPTTEENGFRKAEVYASYEEDEVYQYGGGASLVASTLYCAGLYGVLNPAERYQHYYWLNASGFLRWGSDAYVCSDGENETVDMKLTNPYSYPVLIKAYNEPAEEKIFVELYGTNPDGLYGTPVHDLTSYYLQGADWVCDRFTNHETRDVFNSQGRVRTDDLHEFDRAYDGDEYYHRHPHDYVW